MRGATMNGGVAKRKGNRGKMVTRNRLKLEKLRESLHCLSLEEEQVETTRSKLRGDGPTLRVLLHDLAVPVGSHGIRVQIHSGNCCTNSSGDVKENSWLTQRGETLDMTENQITSEKCDRYERRPNTLSTCSDKEKQDNIKSQTRVSYTSACKASLKETSPKRKFDGSEKETKLKNFKGSSSRFKWETLGQLSSISNVQFSSVPDEGTRIAINNDHNSPSPPNSPLYDMPSPSTPAQKQARRAKRQLQLERWRKYDVSRSRQERYKKRNQQITEMTLSVDSRHIQWSHDLVQTVYIDDEFE